MTMRAEDYGRRYRVEQAHTVARDGTRPSKRLLFCPDCQSVMRSRADCIALRSSGGFLDSRFSRE